MSVDEITETLTGVKVRLSILLINATAFILGVIALILIFFLDIPIHHRGFFCDDDNIRYPWKSESVTTTTLLLVTTIPALVTIITSEAVHYFISTSQVYGTTDPTGQAEIKDGLRRRRSVQRVLFQIGLLIFAFCMMYLVTEVFKLSAGRLRPNFLAVCQLSANSYNCSEGYVTEYTCTQPDKDLLKDARKSFLSGHASISFFFMTFIIMYLEKRMSRQLLFLKTLVQVVSLICACVIGVSRVSDNMHFPSDVLAGGLLGALFGLLTAKIMVDMFPDARKVEDELHQVKVA